MAENEHQETAANFLKHIAAEDPKKAVPAYDIRGNLLLPRRMTREQIQQFVAERDAKKKLEKEK